MSDESPNGEDDVVNDLESNFKVGCIYGICYSGTNQLTRL